MLSRRRNRGQTACMNPKQYDALRRKYRYEWDAHQVIAHRNALLVRTGRQPSNEQLIDEQRAAAAVALIRDELLSAMPRSGTAQD
jgi:hypothetical protein